MNGKIREENLTSELRDKVYKNLRNFWNYFINRNYFWSNLFLISCSKVNRLSHPYVLILCSIYAYPLSLSKLVLSNFLHSLAPLIFKFFSFSHSKARMHSWEENFCIKGGISEPTGIQLDSFRFGGRKNPEVPRSNASSESKVKSDKNC